MNDDYFEAEADWLADQGFRGNFRMERADPLKAAIQKTGAKAEVKAGVVGTKVDPTSDCISLWTVSRANLPQDFWEVYDKEVEKWKKLTQVQS